MNNKINELIHILGKDTVLDAVLSCLTTKSLDYLADSIAKEYNVSFDPYDYKTDEAFLELSEDDKKLISHELEKINTYKCLERREYITDSSYYDISDEFANKYNYKFDDDNGYPDIVYTFTSLAWKIIHNTKYI